MKKKLLFLFALFPLLAQAQTDSVLVLSDIHVDLTLKTDVFYHKVDTDTALFNSAVKNASFGKYAFIMMPGDLLSHGDTHTEAGITNEFKYIVNRVQQIDKNAIVLPALGNNDCLIHNAPDTGTYRIFYNSLLARIDHNKSIYNTFKVGGYYTYNKGNLTLIALNTLLFAFGPDDEAIKELNWLEKTLLKYRKANKKVWMFYHIPPGTDRYGETPSWHADVKDKYLAIIKKYADIIKFQLAGHTHMKDAELITDGSKLISYVAIAPGLDTRNGNDPAYQVFHFNKLNKVVTEIRTYYSNGAHPYQWESFTFKALDFDFLSNYKSDSSLGASFVKDYPIRRGVVKSKSGSPIIWDAKFSEESKVK
jgi:sphingomyelin phosphodiesterase acid-like 3